MKKLDIKSLILLIMLILYTLTYNLVVIHVNRDVYNIISWFIIFIITYNLLGYTKNKSVIKKLSIQYVIIYFILYFILIYFLGLITGFNYSPFSHKIIDILKNISFVTITILFKELVRYMLLFKTRFNKKAIVYITIVYIVIDILMLYGLYEVNTALLAFIFVGEVVIKSIYNNVFKSILSYNAGFLPSFIYSILLEGYIYLVPIVPDLGLYLTTILGAILPIALLLKVNSVNNNYENVTHRSLKPSKKYINVIVLVILFGVVALISGFTKYKVMAIASNSMQPFMSRGDATIIEKINDKSLIKVDDIIVFYHDDTPYVHRVVEIAKKNNKHLFYTKGDNNPQADDFITTEDDVFGVLKIRIKYIGYPTLWVSEAFK